MRTILCMASYFKGGAFLEECKRLGCHTILITSQDLEHEAWPRHAIDEFFVMPFVNLFKQPDITYAVSYLARTRQINRIIALDDFDVETVADLREHLRIPGMGGSTSRWGGALVPHTTHDLRPGGIHEAAWRTIPVRGRAAGPVCPIDRRRPPRSEETFHGVGWHGVGWT